MCPTNWVDERWARVAPAYTNVGVDSLYSDQKKAIVTHQCNQYLNDRDHSSFLVMGRPQSGRMFTVYTYLHELVTHRIILPSQFTVCMETKLVDIVNIGYKRRDELDKLFDQSNEIIVIDGVGEAIYPSQYKEGRRAAWNDLASFITRNRKTLILVSAKDSPTVSKAVGAYAWAMIEPHLEEYRLA